MKLLLISDVETPALWDYYHPSRVEGVDAIISCGDLKADYLEFLVTMVNRPLFYVPGNHDVRYLKHPPEGCDCLDGQLVTFRGLRMVGLGGSVAYSGGPYQYTEAQMCRRIAKLRRQIRKAGGVDIVVTHSAMRGYGDAEDPAHIGFSCFRQLLDTYHPAYLFHGHVHGSYDWNHSRATSYGSTTIINAYERHIIEIPDPPADDAGKRKKATRTAL